MQWRSVPRPSPLDSAEPKKHVDKRGCMNNFSALWVLICMGCLHLVAQSGVSPLQPGPEVRACSLFDAKPDQGSSQDDSALLSAYNLHAHLLRSLHIVAMMQVKAGAEYGIGVQPIEAPAVIDSAKPNLIRVILVLPQLGGQSFEMASDGREFSLQLPGHGRKVLVVEPLDGPAQPQNTWQNLRPQPLLDALSWPEATLMGEAQPQTASDSRIRKLTVTLPPRPTGPRTAQIEFDLRGGLVNSITTYDSTGRPVSTVKYSDWQAVASTQGSPSVSCLPLHIELAQPTQDYQIALRVLQIALNPEIPPSYFHPAVAGGTPVVHLDQPGKIGNR